MEVIELENCVHKIKSKLLLNIESLLFIQVLKQCHEESGMSLSLNRVLTHGVDFDKLESLRVDVTNIRKLFVREMLWWVNCGDMPVGSLPTWV